MPSDSGPDPIDRRPARADAPGMTVAEVRTLRSDREIVRFGREAGEGQAASSRRVQELRERVLSSSYEVDPDRVAEAIIARLRRR